MTSSSFYEEGSRLLTPGAFEFVLDSELKRAVRSQNFLTLVTVVFVLMFVLYKWWTRPAIAGTLFALFLLFYFGSMSDKNFRDSIKNFRDSIERLVHALRMVSDR